MMGVTVRWDVAPPHADEPGPPDGMEWVRVEMEVMMAACQHRSLFDSWVLCSRDMRQEDVDRLWSALVIWGQQVSKAFVGGDCPVCGDHRPAPCLPPRFSSLEGPDLRP
jgi:hypothetical protein